MYKTTFSVGSYSIRLLLLMKQVVIAIKFDQADGGGGGGWGGGGYEVWDRETIFSHF